MSKIAALKKKATEFEQKKQFDKALTAYVQVLEESESSGEEIDVGLYNRVGDLMLRVGNVGDAVTYYEKAVDLYSDGGFFNNAIALCNKILRQSPGRTSIYYKLGKISAQKGFKSDAKKNFLEYADRMQQAGQTEEAFRALKEFADLSPDQDDIRLMLAEQLSKQGKKDEAMEQFQSLLDKYDSEGREQETRATIERMKAIDPSIEPRPSGQQRQRKSTDLVFLDLSDEPRQSGSARAMDIPPADRSTTAPRVKAVPEPEVKPRRSTPALDGLAITSFGDEEPPAPPVPLDTVEDVPEPEPIELEIAAEPAAEIDLISSAEEQTSPPVDIPMLDTSEPAPRMIEPVEDMSFSSDIGGGGASDLTFISTGDEEEASSSLESLAPAQEESEFKLVSSLDDAVVEQPIELDVSSELAIDAPADFPVADTPAAEPESARPQRKSTSILARSVDGLRVSVEIRPDDWGLRRNFGEALLEDGERERGLAELDASMVGYEKAGELDNARSVADEIVKVNPDSIRHLQKRVEYAFRSSDRSGLAECYVELADAMLRAGQTDKARSVYQRVLDLNPDDFRAQTAIGALADQAPPAPEPPPTAHVPRPSIGARPSVASPRMSSASIPPAPPVAAPPPTPKAPAAPSGGDDDFVDLGAWLREDEGPKDTRMVVAEEEPTGDEQADFQDMLKKFKQGVAENVEDEDYASHYDLGVAYKEMGLVDEAIAEFQKALRAPELKVRCYEALGQCFMEKSQPQIANTILSRALSEKGIDDGQLIGVLYLLGNANEELKRPDDALTYYNRVFSVDIQFRDVGERINALEKVAR